MASEDPVAAVTMILQGRRYVPAAIAAKVSGAREKGIVDELNKNLSPWESQVFSLLGRGESLTGIAAALSVSITSVSTYRVRTLVKMGMKTTSYLIGMQWKKPNRENSTQLRTPPIRQCKPFHPLL